MKTLTVLFSSLALALTLFASVPSMTNHAEAAKKVAKGAKKGAKKAAKGAKKGAKKAAKGAKKAAKKAAGAK